MTFCILHYFGEEEEGLFGLMGFWVWLTRKKSFFLVFFSILFCSILLCEKRRDFSYDLGDEQKHDAYQVYSWRVMESDIDVGRVSSREAANRVYGFTRAEYNIG